MTKENIIQKIVQAGSIPEAEKIIDLFSRPQNPKFSRADFFQSREVCQHLGWLIFRFSIYPESPVTRIEEMRRAAELNRKGYEIGKRLYKDAVEANGAGSLTITPILMAWHERFIAPRIGCNDPADESYLSDEELSDISRMTCGEMKDMIASAYWIRTKRKYFSQERKASSL